MIWNKHPYISHVAALAAAIVVLGYSAPLSFSSDSSASSVAFVHVNVIAMDKERMLEDQTVVVEHGFITAVGTAVSIPQNAQIIGLIRVRSSVLRRIGRLPAAK
jgi:hypothetical protein